MYLIHSFISSTWNIVGAKYVRSNQREHFMVEIMSVLGPRGWGGLWQCRNGNSHIKEKALLKVILEMEKCRACQKMSVKWMQLKSTVSEEGVGMRGKIQGRSKRTSGALLMRLGFGICGRERLRECVHLEIDMGRMACDTAQGIYLDLTQKIKKWVKQFIKQNSLFLQNM